VARIRTVKPEFWTSEQVMELSALARLAFIGLWNFCDDAGVHPASAKRLKAEVFPSDEISLNEVSDLIAQMVGQGLLAEFENGGGHYWYITGWAKHQKIDKPTYRHPQPPGWTKEHKILGESLASDSQPLDAPSPSDHRVIGEDSTPEWKGKEGKEKEKKKKSPGAVAPKVSQKNLDSNASTPSVLGVRELIADGVDETHAKEWLKVRKDKRLTLTGSAWDDVKTEAQKLGITPAEAVRIAARKSWGGFEAEWALKSGIVPPANAVGSKASWETTVEMTL